LGNADFLTENFLESHNGAQDPSEIFDDHREQDYIQNFRQKLIPGGGPVAGSVCSCGCALASLAADRLAWSASSDAAQK